MKHTLLLTALLIASISAFSQKKEMGFWENLFKNKSSKMEFKQINHNIIIPAKVNDSDTLWFILDTGLNTSLITELTSTDSLSINYARKVRLNGLGGGESLEAYSSINNNIKIGDINFKKQAINVLLQDIFFLSRKAGCKINGIIGSTVFEKYIVDIDYVNNEIEFIKPEFYEYKKRNKTVCLPLEFIGRKPYINTWITDSYGQRSKVKLLVDTGASLAIWLQENETISKPEKNIYNIIGQGLNGDIHGHIGRINEIEIGKFTLKNPLVSFPDTSALRLNLLRDNRNGSIGGNLLRRFNIVIDYPNKQICFRRNRSFNKPFLYNNSGIDVETPFPGLKVFIINNVMENSPAHKAGIKQGDQIISINNKDAQELDLQKIYKTLSSTRRKKIRITILRDGKKYESVIITEKLI
jgi:hypothetical protein